MASIRRVRVINSRRRWGMWTLILLIGNSDEDDMIKLYNESTANLTVTSLFITTTPSHHKRSQSEMIPVSPLISRRPACPVSELFPQMPPSIGDDNTHT